MDQVGKEHHRRKANTSAHLLVISTSGLVQCLGIRWLGVMVLQARSTVRDFYHTYQTQRVSPRWVQVGNHQNHAEQQDRLTMIANQDVTAFVMEKGCIQLEFRWRKTGLSSGAQTRPVAKAESKLVDLTKSVMQRLKRVPFWIQAYVQGPP